MGATALSDYTDANKDNKHAERHRKMGLKISYYRKDKRMSQEELAEKTNMGRSHLSAIEAPNMYRVVSLNKLYDIADVLDVPITKFFDYEDER